MAGPISAGVVLGSAGLSAGASLLGASKNAKAASSAADKQLQAQQQQLQFQRDQYNRYLGLMGPIEEQLAHMAQSSQPLDYDQMKAQIQQNYSNAVRNSASQMGMRGMAGSGTDLGMSRGLAFNQAGALSGAYAQGLQNRRNLGLSLTGRGQIGQAAQGVAGGLQGMANLYGGQANLFNQAAAQGWNNFGNAINSGIGQWGNMMMQQKWLDAMSQRQGLVPGLARPQAPYPTASSVAPQTTDLGLPSLPEGVTVPTIPFL